MLGRPIRTMIYGFHEPSLAAAIDELQATSVINPVHWIGVDTPSRKFDDCIKSWHLRGIPSAFDAASQADLRNIVQRAIRDRDLQIREQFARNPLCLSFGHFDYQRLALESGCHFAQMLRSKGVEFLVFQNLPHEGFELVLYLVAKEMGVPTLLLYQTVLPNRFCYCYDLSDFGWFKEIHSDPKQPRNPTPMGHHKDLFYMRDCQSPSKKRRLSSCLNQWWLHKKIGFKLWKQELGWYDRFQRSQPRIPPSQRYEFELARHTTRGIDWQSPFVYFPLHLQPELTTSAIGDRYSDQMLALEELREWLPSDWQILVKENPKQSYRHRDPDFFRRLRGLSRVHLVDRWIDTYKLLEKCQFAATVTGTVGWEAITGGKRVVVFGRPWYLSLTGVHHWPVCQTPGQLGSTPISRLELERSFDLLQQKMAAGIVDVAYRVNVPDFSESANTISIRDFLKGQTERLLRTILSSATG